MKLHKKVQSLTLVLTLCGCASFLSSCFAFGDNGGVKEPPYSLLRKSGDYQLRRYAPMILAQVKTKGSWNKSSNTSFRDLFRYIDGQNTANKKVAMTAPVLTESDKGQKIPMTAPVFIEENGDEKKIAKKIPMTAPVFMNENVKNNEKTWTMSFVMPAQFTIESTPKPLNPRVKIVTQPAKKFAVIRFSGIANVESRQVQTQLLLAWIKTENMTQVSAPTYAGYDAPFVLPAFRRNEVLIEVK